MSLNISEILDALSLRAVRHRLDKRKLQEELDLHRLFLLTTYHACSRQGQILGDDAAIKLDAEAQSLGLEGLRSAVSSYLSHQIYDLAKTLHTALAAPGIEDAATADALEKLWQEEATRAAAPPTPQHRTGLGSGFGAAINPQARQFPSLKPSAAATHPGRLSQQQVSDALLSAAGFSLHVGPSSVPHVDAGDGLWIRGSADVGQIVGFYPGVAYPPLHHRYIPGYPLVARSNPYLLSRFDGVVLDAKPWGKGRQGSEIWPGEMPQNAAEEALGRLEGRSPLALAHWANHPLSTQPNVVVAAVDWNSQLLNSTDSKGLRAYVPVVQFTGKEESVLLPGPTDPAPCVALVALRDLKDEELFLNYRLNPNAPGGLPKWYSAVDAEEDGRRWA